MESRHLLSAAPSVALESIAWQGRTTEAVVDRWVGQLASSEGAAPAGGLVLQASLSASHPDWRATVLGDGYFSLFAPTATEQEVLGWASMAGVIGLEPDLAFHAAALPNDPSFASQWALRNSGQNGGTIGADIRATQAWDVTTGSRSVVVGIVDSGIDITHPDLAANIWTNPGEIPGNGVDDDANGYIDDVHGWNFVDNTNLVDDGFGHGTHVAGTVGAVGNNGIGVAGVSWQVSLMALKFQDSRGIGSSSSVLAALNYATMMRRDHGINIVATNNSWQTLGGLSSLVQTAIQAEGDAGIVFVAAAGNNGSDNDAVPRYPAGYRLPNVITVAATDGGNGLAGLSNYGATTVDLGAPGIMIQSTFPLGTYGILSGTSMAAPQVTGVVALLAAAKPGITVAEIRAAILGTTTPVAALFGKTVTGGRLDARAALDALNLPAGAVPQPSSSPQPAPVLATTPPPAPAVALLHDTGTSDADRITRDGTLTVTGLTADARVEYSVDLGRTWADSFTARNGVNVVSVRQTSLAGLRSPTTSLRFTLDAVAPARPRVALERDTGLSATDRITRVGTLRVAAEAGSRVDYSTDDGLTWADSFTAVEGGNTVRVRQTDVAGNTSPPTATALAFTLLTSGPQVVAAPAAVFTPQAAGGVIDVTLAFDRRVRVSFRPGTAPTIDVTLGGQTLRATLTSGSGGTQLRFRCRTSMGAAAAALAGPPVVGELRLPAGSLIQDLAGNRVDAGVSVAWLTAAAPVTG
jgi:subtilisin family serine protease